MSAKYKSPSFLLPNELNTSANPLNTDGDPATGTGVNSLYSISQNSATRNERINIGDVNLGTTNTVSIWLYIKTNVGFADTILGLNSAGAYFWFLSSTALRVQVSAANNIANFTNNDIQSNVWQHLVVTREGTDLRLFVNGVYKQLVTIANGALDSLVSDIGGRAVYGGSMRGQIDEVSFYTSALTYGNVSIGQSVSSDSEIAKLYDSVGSSVVPSNLMATSLNPVAYYPLGEQAQNSGYPSATGNEWQFPNGVLQDYVMDFDGSASSAADFISTSNTSIGNIGSNPHTFSAWINIADHGQVQTILSNKNSNGWKFEVSSGASPDNITFYISGTNLLRATFPSSSYGSWINAVAVINGSSSKIYINGVDQSASVTGTLVPPDSSEPLIIGAQDNGSGTYIRSLNGQMSNVQIFNSALPLTGANSVQTLYNNGSPLTDMSGFTSLTNWWKLNADSVYTPSAPNYTNCIDPVQDNYREQIIVNTNGTNLTTWTVSMWAVGRSHTLSYLWSSQSIGLYWTGYQLTLWGTTVADYTVIPSSQDNKWGHYVVTREAGISKVYFNGKEIYSGTPGGNLFVNDLFIGGWNRYNYPTGNVGEIFNWGEPISNFGAWDSALTSSQVSTLFNFGTPETTPSFSPLHYFKLDNITTGLNNIGSSSENAVITPNYNNSGNGVISNDTNAVAVVPSWKIPSALTVPTVNYTSALEFNGSSDYIDIGSSIDVTGNTSFSYWFKAGNTTQFGTVLDINSSSTTNKIWTGLLSGKIWAYTGTGNSVKTTTNYLANTWYHITVIKTSSASISHIYVNGVAETLISDSGTFGVLTTGGRIGNQISYSSYFSGSISNLAVFNSALSASQVATLYNSDQPEAAISFSPQAWWKLNVGGSTITDYGSGGNNGTNSTPGATQVTSDVYVGNIPVNGVSTTLPSTALQQSDLQFDSPYSNFSLSFDGTGDYVSVTQDFSSYTSMSVSGWVRTASTSQYQYLFSTGVYNGGAAGNGQGFGIGFDNTGKFAAWAGGANYFTFGSVSANTWYHITQTITGTTLKFYVNGVLTSTQTVGTLNIPSSSIAVIGGYSGNATPTQSNLYGNADELSIFNYELTAAQILEIYNNGKPGDLDNFSGTVPTNWWRLGENAYFNTGTTPGPEFTVPNSIAGAPNGIGSGTVTSMLSADAPGTYANGIGTNLDIIDRVGDASLSVANSQSYNMIPDDKVPYVPGYVGLQTTNAFEMTFDGVDDYFNTSFSGLNGVSETTISIWAKTSNVTLGRFLYGNRDSSSPFHGLACQTWTDGNIYFYVNSLSYLYFNMASYGIQNDKWFNIVFVYNGSGSNNSEKVKIYVDGNIVGYSINGNFPSSLQTTLNPLTIGLDQAINSYWNGLIDEVAIFDKALTADQVKFDLYEPTTTGKTADIENNTNLPTPLAWYRMGD